jgi:hypothetical protein
MFEEMVPHNETQQNCCIILWGKLQGCPLLFDEITETGTFHTTLIVQFLPRTFLP